MHGRYWNYEDLNTLAALEAECFPIDGWNMRMLAEAYLSEHFFGVLLEEEGTITAYGGIQVVEGDCDLELIATAEMFRRCGRGKKVLEDLENEARRRGARRMFLEVRVSNSPAILFYLKNGFQGVYSRTRYYPDGEDAIVMRKELV